MADMYQKIITVLYYKPYIYDFRPPKVVGAALSVVSVPSIVMDLTRAYWRISYNHPSKPETT
jgi:hypothetical protein